MLIHRIADKLLVTFSKKRGVILSNTFQSFVDKIKHSQDAKPIALVYDMPLVVAAYPLTLDLQHIFGAMAYANGATGSQAYVAYIDEQDDGLQFVTYYWHMALGTDENKRVIDTLYSSLRVVVNYLDSNEEL